MGMFGRDDHNAIIYEIACGLKAASALTNYLELGVRKGGNFNKIAPLAKHAYAVDIEEKWYDSIKTNKNLIWNHMSTTEFLTNHKGAEFDLVFIDANHTHEASLEDFNNVLPHTRPNGIILLHDTYPPNDEHLKPSRCGDTYKTAEFIKDNYSKQCEIVTLPFFYGVSIVRKASKQLDWKK